mgnify:FL=1
MNGTKRIAATIAMAAVCLMMCMPVSAASTNAMVYDAVLEDAAKELSKVIGTDTTVAIVAEDPNSDAFPQRLSSDLEMALMDKGCLVLDRSNIDAIVSELEFQTSGLVDDDQAVSIGYMLGARMMIVAGSTGGVSSHGLDIQLIDVETTLVVRHLTYEIKYDAAFLNILEGGSSDIGDQRFSIGLRGGVSIGFNKAHEDMVGTGTKPAEKTPLAFVPTLAAFYRFTDTLKLQLGLSFCRDTGIDVLGLYDDSTGRLLDIHVAYSTLDVPVMVSWSFIRRPVEVSALVGAYVSLPLTAANISYSIEGYGDLKGSVDMDGFTFGAVAGFDVGFDLGPGRLVLDARVFYDAVPSKAKGELLGDEPQGVMHRRGFVASAGYMFGL